MTRNWRALLSALFVTMALCAFAPDAFAQARYDISQLDPAVRSAVLDARGAQTRALQAAGRAQGRGAGTVAFTGHGGDSYLGEGYAQGDSDQRNGYGLMTWADGEYYAGQHRGGTPNAGNKEGFGVYVFADGRMYEGQFGNDLQNGYGVLWDRGGAIAFAGRWVDARPQQ
jgi:hypothetical protein